MARPSVTATRSAICINSRAANPSARLGVLCALGSSRVVFAASDASGSASATSADANAIISDETGRPITSKARLNARCRFNTCCASAAPSHVKAAGKYVSGIRPKAAKPPRHNRLASTILRISTEAASVSAKAIKAPPKFAPSTIAIAASTGKTPCAANVTQSRTAARLECISHANTAAKTKAVTRSRPR